MTGFKRKGRPPKSENGTKVLSSMRLDALVYDRLREEAEREGRSITAQAERRLSQPEVGEIARVVDLTVRGIESRAGGTWRDGAHIQVRILAAVNTVLSMMLGEPLDKAALKKSIAEDEALIKKHNTGFIGELQLMFAGVDRQELAEKRSLEDAVDGDEIFAAREIVLKGRRK